MDKKLFQTGDLAPVSGNYQFVKHTADNVDCVPRLRAYLHLMKGMKLPPHDQCLHPCVYSLMTVTSEEDQAKFKG